MYFFVSMSDELKDLIEKDITKIDDFGRLRTYTIRLQNNIRMCWARSKFDRNALYDAAEVISDQIQKICQREDIDLEEIERIIRILNKMKSDAEKYLPIMNQRSSEPPYPTE